jgi:hypothetical protein
LSALREAAVAKNPHCAWHDGRHWNRSHYSGDNIQMNEEQPNEPPPLESEQGEQAAEPVRNEPQAQDPRRRLRELLLIPDHQRTDAIWDEIIELEICLAPGNRVQGAQAEPGRRPVPGQNPGQSQGRRPEQARRPDAAPGTKPSKRFFKKSKRPPGAPPKV